VRDRLHLEGIGAETEKLEENRDVGSALEPDEEKETLDAAAGNVANPHLNVCG